MPAPSISFLMRSASAKFLAFLAATRAAISSSMRCGVSPSPDGSAWRNSCGRRSSNPSIAPSDLSRRASLSDRVLFSSLARSNSTATASGVLKSSFIASRKRAARSSVQSTGAGAASTSFSAV
jgi:hypothetical protein